MSKPADIDRGRDTTRIEAFVDAAFAFALTLLVISFDEIPDSYEALVQALRGIPAFLASFAIITMFWMAHRTWSKRYGLDTTFSTIASLAMVFVILVYVYPLRQMTSAAFSAITGGWAPSDIRLTSVDEVRGFFTIYAVGFITACFSIVVLYAHAWTRRHDLGLSAFECRRTRNEVIAWTIVASSGVASLLIAVLVAEAWLPLAGWVYALLPFVMGLFSWLIARNEVQYQGT